jgi:hypothetical protein
LSGQTARVEPVAPLSSRRKWLFRLFALVVVPLVLLGGLEIILRLADYGYSTGFFEIIRSGGKKILVNNENFNMRFFPPQLARWPGPVMMEAKKLGIMPLTNQAGGGGRRPSVFLPNAPSPSPWFAKRRNPVKKGIGAGFKPFIPGSRDCSPADQPFSLVRPNSTVSMAMRQRSFDSFNLLLC